MMTCCRRDDYSRMLGQLKARTDAPAKAALAAATHHIERRDETEAWFAVLRVADPTRYSLERWAQRSPGSDI
ncbi:hypothetical protein FRZ44_38440 [Hypericibacter terrae]|uniref:Uncharacterized protein n=1 Tax=Hypericibacter terrae TaxID=2602015 RepID=A0A5J6MMZ8_9PROT|nr:hypothetical protein [Hypericibacter terrae]QEX18537.1 hypothetical protein FRZ44_38440 [Hypericibacter terrae]